MKKYKYYVILYIVSLIIVILLTIDLISRKEDQNIYMIVFLVVFATIGLVKIRKRRGTDS